ncbi:MAG: hypothetical protein IJ840_03970, partial [Bacteroidales bacterium]|nr:hypothetical protein [Bacteroidales bacterium]
EPDIQECFTPAFNFTRINSSNGRLAFTPGKVYWLPDSPMALLDQGWVINVSEIASYEKYGISGFTIKLVDGKDLRFSNVGSKMREGIIEAIESHKEDIAAETPSTEPAPAAEAPEAAPVQETASTQEVASVVPPAPQTPPPTGTCDPDDINANKLMAVLAYFGILVLIPLFAAKESKYARFHVNQGLILLICCVVSIAISRIPGVAFIAWILNIFIFVLAVIGIINAVKGKTKEIPLVGKYKIIS